MMTRKNKAEELGNMMLEPTLFEVIGKMTNVIAKCRKD